MLSIYKTISMTVIYNCYRMFYGAICYLSPVCVGSISDVELTRLLTVLEDKPSISTMADRGFTIKDMLKELILS